jgi:tetratricopeptide (TPR) repeat protein
VERRHVAYYRALAEEVWRRSSGAEQGARLARLEPERDNLRATLRQLVGRQDAETAMPLCATLYEFWWAWGDYTEGLAQVRAVLSLPGAADFPQHRGLLLLLAGIYLHALGDYPSARAYKEESLAIRRELGDPKLVASSLSQLGITLRELGDYPAARAALEECLALSWQVDNKIHIAIALERLGTVAHAAGDYTAAGAYYEESLPAAKAAWGDVPPGWTELNLACLALDRGDTASAHSRLREVLLAGSSFEGLWFLTYVLAAAASLACAERDSERAFRLAGAVDALVERTGAPLAPTYQARMARSLALPGAALGEAGDGAARAAGRALTPEQAIAEALTACR